MRNCFASETDETKMALDIMDKYGVGSGSELCMDRVDVLCL